MCVIFSVITKHNRYFQYAIYAGILSLIIFLPAGCGSHKEIAHPENYSYHNPQKEFNTIGRVAFIEIQNDTSYTQISSDITEELFQAIQKKQVFGLTLISQNDPSWRNLKIEPDTEFTPELFQEIRSKLKCDGILTGTITTFSPHPHTAVGLKMKMLDLSDGQLVWAIDQVWDSTDKNIEQKIKKYFKQQISDSSSTQEQLVSISPIEFFKFVGYEVAATLEKN
jgi:hypothetical protein